MLDVLRRIVQEVNAADTLDRALDVLVSRIREAMNTEVCSIYLLDHTAGLYVLMATEGLNKSAVGHATLGIEEGLVGQVGLREEPINLQDASEHPSYCYLSETGEERFSAFLGVPVIHRRKLLGVLVVQQAQKRRFDQSEEAFLITVSAQLAGVVAHAEATGAIGGVSVVSKRPETTRLEGVPGATGIAIGQTVVVYPPADLHGVPDRGVDDVNKELDVFKQALAAVRQDVETLKSKSQDTLGAQELALFDVYLHMLDDNALGGEIQSRIKAGMWAQGAVREVILNHVQALEQVDDPYLRDRSVDVRDLGQRLLMHLREVRPEATEYPAQTILVGAEITTPMLLEVPRERLVGIVSAQGSSNSHMAIVARAIGVPTVVGVEDLPLSRLQGMEVVVDGYRGEVILNINEELQRYYRDMMRDEQLLVADLEMVRDVAPVTPDGYHICLWVNTGLMADVGISLDRGAEGVGLYRTEIPFMMGDRFPSEFEQQQIYREQLEAFAPLPVTMRTLDIGGDKSLPYFPITEDNPFLGWRGIRVTLDHPEIFLVQVRAMLWASEGLNNLRIMLPMASTLNEVEEALQLIQRAYQSVLEEGAHVVMPPVGMMVEVPAAVYQAREFAERADFLSVGSNDLTQYMLAVDRNNRRVAGLYHSFHPAVLAALQRVVVEAHKVDTPVSICGEMAGDPVAAVLLMAMGYDSLSMSASSLLKVKWVIRHLPMPRARELLADVLKMDTAAVIRSYLTLALEREGLGRFIGPVK